MSEWIDYQGLSVIEPTPTESEVAGPIDTNFRTIADAIDALEGAGGGAAGQIHLTGLTSDPSNPQNGWIWYRSDLHEFRGRDNGVTRKFIMAPI